MGTTRMEIARLRPTAGKRITLVFGELNVHFHEESSILAEKTQSAGIANSLTGDTLCNIAENRIKKHVVDEIDLEFLDGK